MKSGMRGCVGVTLCVVLLSALPWSVVAGDGGGKLKIAQVFFAQNHVLAPDHPLFKLVGNLDALIKVQVYSPTSCPSPVVCARLELGSKALDLPLKGPAQLPKPPTGDPMLMEQKYEDSFTAVIPREWIASGLKVAVELKEGNSNTLDSVVFDKLRIGAPNRLNMTMFDFHYFGRDMDADYPKGWLEQFGARLPVAGVEVLRVRNIVLDKVVMLPGGGRPATLCGSREEYKEKTGIEFDGECGISARWNRALRQAAGTGPCGTQRLYYLNIYGVPANGDGGEFMGVGDGTRHGLLMHELGHAFGLPDLFPGKALARYPYCGPMHGIPAPKDSGSAPHVGPVWGFDPAHHTFISPTTEDGHYKSDPMGGGGANKEGGPGLYRFFSDYHCSRIRDRVEQNQVIWDARAGAYAKWDPKTGSYSLAAGKPDLPTDPVEEGVEVISVLVSASLATGEANIVYPLIGPYKTGYIKLFDAASAADRAKARTAGYEDGKCNICLRVTQDGKVKSYLVKEGLDPGDDRSLCVFAINLPARDGEVTHVDLLHTPGVMDKGIGPECKVLYSWSRASSTAPKTVTVTFRYPEG